MPSSLPTRRSSRREMIIHIVPLRSAYKAGLAGHVPAKHKGLQRYEGRDSTTYAGRGQRRRPGGACLTNLAAGSGPERFGGPNFKLSILKFEIKAGDISRFQ